MKAVSFKYTKFIFMSLHTYASVDQQVHNWSLNIF